jgi:carbamoyl-phosphate synthase small subunit
MHLEKDSKLVLEDGSVFEGISFGAKKPVAGEVVFATGMVGYPESFTDPSYKGQILCLTYPLVGNYGIPSDELDEFGIKKNFESYKAHIQGLIISDYSFQYSHWNAKKGLSEWLIENDIPAIFDVDTRALTKKLRHNGAMLGKILVSDKDIKYYDPNKDDLVKDVSIKSPIFFDCINKQMVKLDTEDPVKKILGLNNSKKTVILIDCGTKYNIIRCLLKRDINVILVPFDYDFFNLNFDGVVISNGPGDPKMCIKTIENVKKVISIEKPIFGICLGNQILALAIGADTYKLKYGHRSQNQPCIRLNTNRCYITTQNHGFAVDPKTIPEDWEPLFTNLNDGTNEGLRHISKPFFSSQFHPEASPGPVDTEFLFDEFVNNIKHFKRKGSY